MLSSQIPDEFKLVAHPVGDGAPFVRLSLFTMQQTKEDTPMKRFTLPVITLLITALLFMMFSFSAGVALASAAKHKPPLPPPDFSIDAPVGYLGFLAQGAIPGSPCSNCNGKILPQPAYPVDVYGDCFYDWNTMGIVPLNGFLGTVTLTLSGLPSGVTSLTTPSVTVTQKGIPADFTFELQASSTATLGKATVTITGTSGSLVHTFQTPISVGTALPPPC